MKKKNAILLSVLLAISMVWGVTYWILFVIE
ncbi:hypothetical protein N784_06245 [Pontibacillus litoralis JSM 072002]|uniref:Uncharacterized protein n=1 Tax=Pontibacillus litoralis JSM 072002 TaxID=1385512 RepID=A0A0A5G4M0_9BACI|nr:hypothetical protein N784_06245 [Pontibacillus litoralis JSM 072002]